MEQRGVLLRGIARVLNAGGSALVTVFDVTASTLGKALPGEKEKLKSNIRAYEKKIERLYYEIGKEVSRQGDTTQVSAAGEAGVKLVAEYRTEIEIIKQRIEEIEAAERIERQRLLEERETARRMAREEAEKQVVIASEKAAPEQEVEREAEEKTYAARTEPIIIAEPFLPEAPVASEASTGAETEEEKSVVAEAAETPEHELKKDAAESLRVHSPLLAASAVVPADAGIQKPDWMPDQVRHDAQYPDARGGVVYSEAPVASEASTGAETEEEKGTVADVSETEKEEPHKYTTEELESIPKAELLALCTEKGIEADRKMRKAEIIELILGWHLE